MENIETGSTGRLEAVFQTSFSLIDQIIVGRLGADAIAGVGLSNSFTFIVLLIYSALGTGSGALIAQAFGRKDMEEVSATAAAGHMAAAFFGTCTAMPLIMLPEVILRWIGAQGEAASQAAAYFQLFAASAPLNVISAVTTGTFRSLSDTRTPMIITAGAVALNTLVGFFFVLGIDPFPRLGVVGVGVSYAVGSNYPVRCFIDCTLSLNWYGGVFIK